MRLQGRATCSWLGSALLLALACALLCAELAEAGKKKSKGGKKKKAKTPEQQLNKRLLKLVKGDASKLGALVEVTDAMMPAQGDSWSLEEDGSNVLEPYAVGSTLMVEALDLREEEPELVANLYEWVNSASAGDAEAKGKLQSLIDRWEVLPTELAGTHKEVVAASEALSWFAYRANEALTCLPVGSCDAADAWLSCRQLGEAVHSHKGKWSLVLETHDIMVAVLQPLHKLAELMVAGYELDMRVRPDGVAERIKQKEAAMKARDESKNAKDDYVDAGALDKTWSKLTAEEMATATELGYTKESFAETAPPIRSVWATLSSKQQGLATSLGWEDELWDNELEALLDEEAEAKAKAEL